MHWATVNALLYWTMGLIHSQTLCVGIASSSRLFDQVAVVQQSRQGRIPTSHVHHTSYVTEIVWMRVDQGSVVLGRT